MTAADILGTLRDRQEDLRAMHVAELALFGSFVRGEETPDSDIDLLVELDVKTYDNYMDLKEYLEALLGRRVDLVLKSALKPRLREPILREAVRVA